MDIFNKFAECLIEDASIDMDYDSLNFDRIKRLPGFPKTLTINEISISVISDDFIFLKGDDDCLIVLKTDSRGDLFVESYKIIEPMFFPTLDGFAIDYLMEVLESKREEILNI